MIAKNPPNYQKKYLLITEKGAIFNPRQQNSRFHRTHLPESQAFKAVREKSQLSSLFHQLSAA